MRETVTSFISRIGVGEYDKIRVEASDMKPIVGYKDEVIREINSKPECLFVINFYVENNVVVIEASFQSI